MENVSHNTSYSECSPNVHEPDEEMINQEEQKQVYYEDAEEEYDEEENSYNVPDPLQDGLLLVRPSNRGESPEPPNISNSEIEEMNYTMGG
jgi:hypothetical protein